MATKKHYLVRVWADGGSFDLNTMAVSERQAVNNIRYRLSKQGRYVADLEFEAFEMLYAERAR